VPRTPGAAGTTCAFLSITSTCAFLPRNVPHAWKNTGSEIGNVLFLYTPADAGGYVEELLRRPGFMRIQDRRKLPKGRLLERAIVATAKLMDLPAHGGRNDHECQISRCVLVDNRA
jgi:hypothetical protein